MVETVPVESAAMAVTQKPLEKDHQPEAEKVAQPSLYYAVYAALPVQRNFLIKHGLIQRQSRALR